MGRVGRPGGPGAVTGGPAAAYRGGGGAAGNGDVVATLVGFARTLRAAGLLAGPDRLHALVAALAHLDVGRREHVYRAGRATLCAGPEDLARYDAAFAAYFGGGVTVRPTPPPRPVVRPVAVPADRDDAGTQDGRPADRAALASRVEVLRHRDVARLSAVEREQVARLVAALTPAGPQRLSRRRRPSRRGPADPRRTLRAMLARGGEPDRPRRHDRTVRPRRLVLLVDVSGSMTPYADLLLRFAHAACRARPGTECFTVGTRLTRVSRELARRDPQAALTAVAAAVPDWSGGTRLGEELKEFLDRWGQRGLARGAVVVLASDGWERGDPALLGAQLERLRRLAHRVVWVNPHKGRHGYLPLTAGMQAALPHVDDLVAGHSLAALQHLVAVLARP